MKLRAIETAKVATITSGTKSMMAVLDCLKDRAAPSDEYTVLAQHYGGKSYWLANMLHTSTPDIQDEMFSILAEKDPAALHDPTMQFTGVKNVVDRFIKTDGELVKAANVAMKKADSAKSHQERIGILWDNFDNRHLRKKIEERIAATNDEELKDSYENMKEIKQEERQKAADRRE